MKTELQELIEMYNNDIIKLKENFKLTESILIVREISTLEHVVTNLESRLDKEKYHLIKAYEKGIQDFCTYEPERHGNERPKGEQYFNSTYKTVSK
jgi:hypothetical protein